MSAYYNEIDPFAADWLRELIKAGHIAPGEVDTRSIEDVAPTDLAGFAQCHFFAGIAVWSYALRLAGWPDDRAVWTGSCPCQPFSAAGKGKGFADERHLWPAFFHLISQCRPLTVFGEQVASKDGLAWLDLVQTDLEGEGYACGAVDTCAAGFGAPHIRQRLYWVAHAPIRGIRTFDGESEQDVRQEKPVGRYGMSDRVADAEMQRHKPFEDFKPARVQQETVREAEAVDGFGDICPTSVRLADSVPAGRPEGRPESGGGQAAGNGGALGLVHAPNFHSKERSEAGGLGGPESSFNQETRERDGETNRVAGAVLCGKPGPVNGHWQNADWLLCRDGKWRPVESGTFPLAYGAANRVGRLRGYGNALNAIQAKEFVRCFIEYRESDEGWPGFSSLPHFAPEAAQ